MGRDLRHILTVSYQVPYLNQIRFMSKMVTLVLEVLLMGVIYLRDGLMM